MFCKHSYSLLIFLSVLIVISVTSERLSGLYVDNGFNQTVAHRAVSPKEKNRLESELLNVLGLPARPKRIARKALLVRRSAPKFLLNIYQSILAGNHDSTTTKLINEFDLTGNEIYAIDNSDVIMTFAAHNPFSARKSTNNRGKRIWFDVSEVPVGEKIIAADLRLYRVLNYNETDNQVYTIGVYRVSRTKDGGRLKHFVDATNVTGEGWITLNVSKALQHWINHPVENRGFFLAVHRHDYLKRTMRPDDIGIVGVLGMPDKQPFMVSFFKSTGIRETIGRRKRNIDRNLVSQVTNPLYHNDSTYRRVEACGRRALYVSFRDLQWQDWIIAPDGYEAFYCSGECKFPLNTHMNATNHAIVQTLVHLMKSGKVPKPCCAPTKLSSISVLYFLDDSNVVLKKYKNMVVNSCGCH